MGVVLVGPSGCGKTTVKIFFKDIQFFKNKLIKLYRFGKFLRNHMKNLANL